MSLSPPGALEQAAGNRVLVLYVHPMPHRSRINRPMAAAARKVPGVTVHELYEHYPDMFIDVQREQALLMAHDVIVWQHPFYWYSTPALLKEWQDVVLTYGWAFGPGGDALHNKLLIQAITLGGAAHAYQLDGLHGQTVNALLAPIAQTARLCGMIYAPAFVAHSVHRLERADVQAHVNRYRALLSVLADPGLDLQAWATDGPPASFHALY